MMPQRHKFAPVILLAALLAGCGGGVANTNATGSSGGNTPPGSNTPGTAQFSVTPSAISFGSVAVGNSLLRTGTLTATGSSVTVSSADWNGQGFSVSGISFPVTIAAGQSTSFNVTFAPQISGSISGSISFISDASTTPAVETLTGAGTTVASQHSVSLSWTPSASSVVGYNVYRGTINGGPYQRLTSSPQPATAYTDSGVQSGATYYYVATSVASNSIESGYSNQTAAIIP
jgi:hypothetical protein